jgi:acyl-coenzyme A synthetase/AMP-(fatty) acid ligase
MFTHPASLEVALSAAEKAGMPQDRIILYEPFHAGFVTVDDLIKEGLSRDAFVERKLNKGEGKSKVAFLSFSSGTTGKPKVYPSMGKLKDRI